MKKLSTLLFCSGLFFLMNCSGSGGSDERDSSNPNNSKANSCPNVNGFQVSQNAGSMQFTINSDLAGPYEISYGQTGGFTPGYGNSFVVNEKTFTKNIDDQSGGLHLEAGKSYTFAVRRYCSSMSQSDWGFERNLTTSGNYCKTPYELKVEDYLYNKIEWKVSNYQLGSAPVKYEVQYGLQGYSPGSGVTVETTNTSYNAPFVAGKAYDIYVRAYCSGSLGWGSWVGPVSFTASNTTACVAPTYANFSVVSSNSTSFTPNVTWDNDGISSYDYSLSYNSGIPTQTTTVSAQGLGGITFTNLSKSTNYYFYVRKRCSGNTTTGFFGPFLVRYN
ncbi:fibronectin type III domain-containing protein [Chryseobacterium sp.]|uniref:fibronectin type III domain-containing protein n=1 Tax=Chryseobacterium sp. TaxID=1871047 RepID=UPI0025C0A3D3|nr:fibronectin type III domain-containing protein [Chryseobacterium sp.]MBV8328489.1 fibronectin type III domain-containing protein [Chryseobacterium sp.]